MRENNNLIRISSLSIIIAMVFFLTYHFLAADDDQLDNNDAQFEGGNMHKDAGWNEVDGEMYYLDEKGYPLTGEQVIEDKVYTFDRLGKWDGADPLDAIVITVERLDEKEEVAISLTGGETWIDNKSPEFYMSMRSVTYPTEIEKLTVTIFNNSDAWLMTGVAYTLLMLDGNEWVSTPTADFVHTEEGYPISPNETLIMECHFRNVSLEAGRYLHVKEVWMEHDSSTKYKLSIEVNLMD